MFTDPVKNLRALGIRENDIVADLGAGTGFYSIAAGRLAPEGKVYAIEVVKDFLTTVKNKALEAHLNNIEIIWGNIEKIGGTKIGDNVVDKVLASNILFQVDDKNGFIEEAKRILKPEGLVLLIDWSHGSSGIGPNFATVIPKDKARTMFEQKGFIWQRDIDAGAHHYGMILVKNKE